MNERIETKRDTLTQFFVWCDLCPPQIYHIGYFIFLKIKAFRRTLVAKKYWGVEVVIYA